MSIRLWVTLPFRLVFAVFVLPLILPYLIIAAIMESDKDFKDSLEFDGDMLIQILYPRPQERWRK